MKKWKPSQPALVRAFGWPKYYWKPWRAHLTSRKRSARKGGRSR
jgi:hypothetical protein